MESSERPMSLDLAWVYDLKRYAAQVIPDGFVGNVQLHVAPSPHGIRQVTLVISLR